MKNIIEKNYDVEHIMLASCRYGHHGYGKKNYRKLFSMLVTTDVHECNERLCEAVEYFNAYEALDCGICLGDMQARNFIETDGMWYTDEIKKAQKPFLTVLGNHDLGNSTAFNISATPKMAFEKFVLPTKAQIGIENLDEPYYVRLFPKYCVAVLGEESKRLQDIAVSNKDWIYARANLFGE